MEKNEKQVEGGLNESPYLESRDENVTKGYIPAELSIFKENMERSRILQPAL